MDLAKISGLKLSFKDGKLSFGKGVVSSPVSSRKADEVRDYLKDKDAAIGLADVYLMYRGVSYKEDEKLFKNNHLRYDITVIFPGFLGEEFPKTVGHHHPLKTGTSVRYPEIYEVLSGAAYFLFQRIEEGKDEAPENYLIKAKAGEKVVVPPGFGHITINPASEPLIVADIFADNVDSIYEYLKDHRGGAYYILKTENQKLKTEKNPNYKKVTELKISTPQEVPELYINFKKPLYLIFKDNPQNLEFLISPEKYKDLLNPAKLFKF